MLINLQVGKCGYICIATFEKPLKSMEFDKNSEINKIFEKAANLKVKIKNTEIKMKILINKSEISKSRSKSTEPTSQPIYTIQKGKITQYKRQTSGILLLTKILVKINQRRTLKILKIF